MAPEKQVPVDETVVDDQPFLVVHKVIIYFPFSALVPMFHARTPC